MKLHQYVLLINGLLTTMLYHVMAVSIPLNTTWPFSEERAKQLQQETASALDLPIEYKLMLAGDVALPLILIPAGEFKMGTSEDCSEFPVSRAETPQRRVRISNPFYMSKYPVTIGQWRAVMGQYSSMPGSSGFSDDHPTVYISWNEICGNDGFLEVLNQISKPEPFSDAHFRLPTEAEWEYACRAGTAGDFSGTGILDDMGWYVSNVHDIPHNKPRPVGLKRPNAWNLYDMHGNVSEWCEDRHLGSYYQSGQWIDPTGPLHGNERVLRGGSINHEARHCRSATRGGLFPHRKGISFGFRIVLSPELFPDKRADDANENKVEYEGKHVLYIGSEKNIEALITAKEHLEHNPNIYDNLARWRKALVPLVIHPVETERSLRIKQFKAGRVPEANRILSQQIRQKQQSPDYSSDDMVHYLESILPHWENHSGRNQILFTLTELHADNPEKRLAYYKQVGPPLANQWGWEVQRARQGMARIYEDQGDYKKAIEAVKGWRIREPCGTGAGSSEVRRWTWLIRLRMKNGENLRELQEHAWHSLRTGEIDAIWGSKAVANCLIELYRKDYDALMADAHKTLASLDANNGGNDYSQWRRKEIESVVDHISLRMRLAGPEWRMTAEEARDRQRKQAESRRLSVEKTVLFDEVPMVFMFIPAGEFLIGSPPDEKGRIPPDEDQDRVRISRPFYMGKYEVTQLQWQNVMGSNPSHFKDKPDSAMRPVDSVSWNDIVQLFLPKIQQYAPSGLRFDLPTEAQWEYACRAGADTPFHFGVVPDRNSANIGGIGQNDDAHLETMPVGSFPANAWGLHDMHGNIQEWCIDAFSHRFYRSHNAVAVDPVNRDGDRRVIRGIWYPAPLSRSAFRSRRTPDHGAMAGFRLALVYDENRKNETEQTPAGDVLKAAPEE